MRYKYTRYQHAFTFFITSFPSHLYTKNMTATPQLTISFMTPDGDHYTLFQHQPQSPRRPSSPPAYNHTESPPISHSDSKPNQLLTPTAPPLTRSISCDTDVLTQLPPPQPAPTSRYRSISATPADPPKKWSLFNRPGKTTSLLRKPSNNSIASIETSQPMISIEDRTAYFTSSGKFTPIVEKQRSRLPSAVPDVIPITDSTETLTSPSSSIADISKPSTPPQSPTISSSTLPATSTLTLANPSPSPPPHLPPTTHCQVQILTSTKTSTFQPTYLTTTTTTLTLSSSFRKTRHYNLRNAIIRSRGVNAGTRHRFVVEIEVVSGERVVVSFRDEEAKNVWGDAVRRVVEGLKMK
ncbi:hypothetical protein BC829DRAFT_400049 [Chytridium lagenaria]|nr:hypothetical protein BC829DRAFT_400049 [Chytridium lagenaria]